MKGWINVYKSGFFHRAGKPGTLDRHGGDLYSTLEKALEDIDPPAFYVATVPVEWPDENGLGPNPSDSQPIPLRVTRGVTKSTV